MGAVILAIIALTSERVIDIGGGERDLRLGNEGGTCLRQPLPER